MRLSPFCFEALNELLLLAKKSGTEEDFETAQELLAASMKIVPHYTRPRKNIANFESDLAKQKKKGDTYTEEKVVALREILEHDPNDCSCWLMLGDSLLRMKKVDEARDAYEKSVEVNDHYVDGYLKMGGIYGIVILLVITRYLSYIYVKVELIVYIHMVYIQKRRKRILVWRSRSTTRSLKLTLIT